MIVIGCSMGGFNALRTVLGGLDRSLPAAVIVCCHAGPGSDVEVLCELLGTTCALPVVEAREREPVRPATVQVAPGGYHLLVELARRFSLSVDAPVSYARPSIDVLFASIADSYGKDAVGVVLTGANADGAEGLQRMRGRGALAVIQDPATAEAARMPQAALDRAGADHCLALHAIPGLLNRLCLA
ncbi:chemotaxis protein CheB [Dyella sp.]|uniref:chemotaxis protein CheB n=1 Tax=Dyella sp. TaxID=1869338 RepID=UPI002D79B9B7|nr:chemotaxis protein CheB [Dyella sp.]HET6430772.1 chemotaxis protein CheB [Dyella sp.]